VRSVRTAKEREASLPQDVRAAMATYADGLRARLRDLVVGLYVMGSAVTPDFQPATSDIDAFVVLRNPLDAKNLHNLKALHRDLQGKTPYGNRLDIEYVAVDQLRPWGVEGDSASISPREQLRIGPSKAAADDLLGARSLGVVIFGPPAEEIFPVVDREMFVASQRNWLDDLTKRHGAEAGRWRCGLRGVDAQHSSLRIRDSRRARLHQGRSR
jgi:predicted nucleotidyltransferase